MAAGKFKQYLDLLKFANGIVGTDEDVEIDGYYFDRPITIKSALSNLCDIYMHTPRTLSVLKFFLEVMTHKDEDVVIDTQISKYYDNLEEIKAPITMEKFIDVFSDIISDISIHEQCTDEEGMAGVYWFKEIKKIDNRWVIIWLD